MVGTKTVKAVAKLRVWMDSQDPRWSQQTLADKLGINQSSVSLWLRAIARPEPHLRTAIDELTRGAVPQDAWMTADERAALSGARKRIARTGSDG